ncbi:hypothetical protein G3T14_12805 [Methylobacterium sp. BTF04]|uniref:hypothetical protein n=1 Tax=Methylobacterium sp. BTF04 TaxID=2708300 RepID=UPI0013D2D18F|nr:hypothetical protein [Methylobacterium sp. BTF04]NEU13013.1 hypothetical protein [Methylobacterium sp. BTF04]
MSVVRRFLVASSLVRLIRKERGGARITEGYFAPQSGRVSYVRVDGQNCHLVLVSTTPDGASSEERTDVPRAHGDALLDVCSGKAAYDRTAIALGGGREAVVDRYVTPGTLDLVSVTFDGVDEAGAFQVPAWFAAEVTTDPAYDRHAVALQGVPQPGEIGVSNAGVEAVLDLVEPRFGFGRYGTAPKATENDGMMKALRRVAGTPATATAAVPMAASPEPVYEEPVHAQEALLPEPPAEAPHTHETAQPVDSRIDDVIESLSQALGNPPPQADAREEGVAAEFERWTVRPRRTQQT